MATANLTWVPFPGPNNSSQVIEYKKNTATTWTTFNTVGPLVTSASITGLLDNVYYDFRITTNCLNGGPSVGSVIPNKIKFVCPGIGEVNTTPTSISFPVFYGADDLTNITVNIYDSAAPLVLVDSVSHNLTVGHTSGFFNVAFTGLTPSTNYIVDIVINGKLGDSKVCSNSISTNGGPSCVGTTMLTVTPQF